jgi:hypothetical protein
MAPCDSSVVTGPLVRDGRQYFSAMTNIAAFCHKLNFLAKLLANITVFCHKLNFLAKLLLNAFLILTLHKTKL